MAELNQIKGLARKTFLTRSALILLRITEAFWPSLLLVSLFIALALFGLLDRMAPAAAAVSTLIVFVGTLILGLRGRQRYRQTPLADAHRALDQESEARPIAGLTDRPSMQTPSAQSLWQAHIARLTTAAEQLSVPQFSVAWRALDPYYLRIAVPALLTFGIILAGAETGIRLKRALMPDYGSLMGAENIRVEAWITPPDYSRRPPVFLRDGLDKFVVPAGSEITVRAQARSAPKLVLRSSKGRTRQRFEATPDGAFEAKALIVGADTTVSVNWWGERAVWHVFALADTPPVPHFDEPPLLGENDRTEFSWSVVDDYGVEKLELALRLVEPHPAAPDDERRVPIDLPGASVKDADEDAALDMTRHPWAGLAVEARLVATDGAGQEGESAPHELVLPEKLFLQTLARATQDIRVTALREPRDYMSGYIGPINALEAAPEGIQKAAMMLEAVTFMPEKFFADYGIFSGLASAHGTLKSATSLEEAASIDGLLWAIALKAEYGSSADALAALLAARRALEKALREGASEEEIARLTDAFRQAAENYVQAKLAEAIANGLPEGAAEDGLDNEQAGGGGSSLGQNSFEDMLNALEDLTATGASDQARQLLSDITNMLENLEFQQGNGSGGDGFALPNQGGEGEEGEQSEEEQALSENLEDLAETLREQRELNDDTLEAGRQGQGTRSQPGEGSQPDGQELADRQEAIADLLQALREGSEQGGEGEAGDEQAGLPGGEATEDALDEALRAQRRAEEALRDGQFARAQRSQEQATSRLRDIAGTIAEELDALRGEDEQNAGTDPFGREVGGANDSNRVDVPDASERQRALDILEELRRRYGDTPDEAEREYLERLLDRF